MKYLKLFLVIFISTLSLFSCVSEEGEGGISVVQGYVYTVLHDDDVYDFVADTFPAAKTDVYIVYGDEPIYGDKMETGYDGFYRFRYLSKGNYKVYAYSTLTTDQKVAVIDSVSVAYGKTVNVNNIYVHEGKSLETSYIKGQVYATYYNNNKGTPTADVASPAYAYGERVYIQRVGGLYQFDEVRTGLDGVFMFQNLEPGDYEVFVFSTDPITEILTPVTKTISVTEKGSIYTFDSIFQIKINT
ncbi:MAG: hypothetical protein PHS59_04355 [Paludibacter sp.]|nr:hypothetical protein [Paludibacter sp.]